MEQYTPLSEMELQLWSAVKQLGEVALMKIGRIIEAETGLSGVEFSVLSRMEDLGHGTHGTLTQSQLLDSMKIEKSRLSHLLSRMETRKLIKRQRPPEARQLTLVMLPLGKKAIRSARPIHAEAVRGLVLSHISPAGAETILNLAQSLSAIDQ